MTLQFPLKFENQISLLAPKQVRPGENVTITINAQPKSYVSVMAVDLGVYLLDNSYDLDTAQIFEELYEKTFSPAHTSGYPGLVSGLITMTNAHHPVGDVLGFVSPKAQSKHILKYRKKFPETWIYDNYFINESTTELTLEIPDTVTTWRITAFTNNDITGFGIVNKPTDITTIQPLFISLNLPYSVKRGEIISIPVTIFNYLNQTVDVEVVLYNDEQEFYFMESKIQGVEKSNGNQQQQIKYVNVPVNKAETVHFIIYPI
ncbi:hypothetical protein DOY81_013417, partial [Sarcophaga bullata]